jgi:hypothetical protein
VGRGGGGGGKAGNVELLRSEQLRSHTGSSNKRHVWSSSKRRHVYPSAIAARGESGFINENYGSLCSYGSDRKPCSWQYGPELSTNTIVYRTADTILPAGNVCMTLFFLKNNTPVARSNLRKDRSLTLRLSPRKTLMTCTFHAFVWDI